MAGDFATRIDELSNLVGSGSLEGKLVQDQVYAHAQHERLDFAHPNGGQAKWLETALHQYSSEYFQDIAGRILEGGGGEAMADAVEKLDNHQAQLCPKQSTVLARSGHPTVTDNGATVYDRAPEVPRLSDDELDAIHRRGISIHKGRRR